MNVSLDLTESLVRIEAERVISAGSSEAIRVMLDDEEGNKVTLYLCQEQSDVLRAVLREL